MHTSICFYMDRAQPLVPAQAQAWLPLARSGPGPIQAQTHAGVSSPGLGPLRLRLQGPGAAHASALSATFVCIFYANLR